MEPAACLQRCCTWNMPSWLHNTIPGPDRFAVVPCCHQRSGSHCLPARVRSLRPWSAMRNQMRQPSMWNAGKQLPQPLPAGATAQAIPRRKTDAIQISQTHRSQLASVWWLHFALMRPGEIKVVHSTAILSTGVGVKCQSGPLWHLTPTPLLRSASSCLWNRSLQW